MKKIYGKVAKLLEAEEKCVDLCISNEVENIQLNDNGSSDEKVDNVVMDIIKILYCASIEDAVI